MLTYVRTALLSDAQVIEADCKFRNASLANVRTLLAAVSGQCYDDEVSLTRRFADLTWYSSPRFSTGPLHSLLSSGRAAAIKDAKLRALLSEYSRELERIAGFGARDQTTMLEDVAPVVGRSANFLEINNESYRYGRPGDGEGANAALVIPVSNTTVDARLLGDEDFALVLAKKNLDRCRYAKVYVH